MNRSKRTALVVVLVIIVACAIWLIHGRRADDAQATDRSSQNQPPNVAVAVVRHAPAETSITVPGVFQAYQDILVHAKVSGYVKKINVDIGDRVHTGEVLAILEVP